MVGRRVIAVFGGVALCVACGPVGPPEPPTPYATPDEYVGPLGLTFIGVIVDAAGARAATLRGVSQCAEPLCVTYPECPEGGAGDASYSDLDAGLVPLDAAEGDADAAGGDSDAGPTQRPQALVTPGLGGEPCWINEEPDVPSHCADDPPKYFEDYGDCPTGRYAQPDDERTKCTCPGPYRLEVDGLRIDSTLTFPRLVGLGRIEIRNGRSVATDPAGAPFVVASWEGRPVEGDLRIVGTTRYDGGGGDTTDIPSGVFNFTTDGPRLERFFFGPGSSL